jgi:hypothetical protein
MHPFCDEEMDGSSSQLRNTSSDSKVKSILIFIQANHGRGRSRLLPLL